MILVQSDGLFHVPLPVHTFILLIPARPAASTHERLDPSVCNNFSALPACLGMICPELPDIAPLITILPTTKGSVAVTPPLDRENPPVSVRSLIDDTFNKLIS